MFGGSGGCGWGCLWQITSSGCSVEMDGEWESRLVSEGLYKESAIWSPCWHLSTPLKTVNHVHSSTLASLKIKTNPCAAISRKAGVEAICRMQTIVYGSLQLSCSNKGSRETTNPLLEAANFILHIQANTLLSTAVTHRATTCSHAESCNWGIPVDGIQKGQWTGFKKGSCLRAPSTFQILLKWDDMSGRAKKISKRRRRSFSSCCSWTNALLLFTATAAGHLAAYSPSLNGGQYASSWLGRTLLPQCYCQVTMNWSRQSACTTFWVPLLLWQLLLCTHN